MLMPAVRTMCLKAQAWVSRYCLKMRGVFIQPGADGQDIRPSIRLGLLRILASTFDRLHNLAGRLFPGVRYCIVRVYENLSCDQREGPSRLRKNDVAARDRRGFDVQGFRNFEPRTSDRAVLTYLALHASRSMHGDFPKGGSYTSTSVEWRDFYEELCWRAVGDRGNRVAHHTRCRSGWSVG